MKEVSNLKNLFVSYKKTGPINAKMLASIHADPPEFVDQSTTPELLETGIKVVDLLAPYARGSNESIKLSNNRW